MIRDQNPGDGLRLKQISRGIWQCIPRKGYILTEFQGVTI